MAYKKLPAVSVGTADIADGSITSAKLAAGAVVAGKLAAGAIDAANLFASGVVDAAAIGVDAVGASEIAANAVAASELADSAVDLAALGVGQTASLKKTFTANGTPANSDDVSVDFGALGLPPGTTWDYFDTIQAIESGGAASATGQVRTAAAGGGSACTTAMSAASNVDTRDAQAAVVSVTSATVLQYRRTGGSAPSGTAGHLDLFLRRTA